MKRLIIWLANVFNVSIEKKVVVYKTIANGVIDGDIVIKGNLVVDGSISASKDVTMYKEV